ncbi:MAG: hypothetical protein BIFFINMI_00823 [Phycisphaerae bacterium]|nr:hypothetical protein [Phycisphaerae bacterium]
MRPVRRIGFLAVALVLPWTQTASAGYMDDIGYTSMVARRTLASQPIPNGSGVKVTQVEASLDVNGTQYLPYTPPSTIPVAFSGKTFTDKTGIGAYSSHAYTVGTYYYGNSGIASGIATIDVYSAGNWLDTGFLRAYNRYAPKVETSRIINASWVSKDSQTSDADAIEITRRLDYMVVRDNVLAVVAVNNGSTTTVPKLLGQSYNAIVVGRRDGGGSHGPTSLDVAGRSKPDIVAPGTASSYATPMVSAAAGLLMQTAGSDVHASKELTIKALLMGGATKTEFVSWSHTQTQPLDSRYGAGELNIDNSDRILTSGEQEASAVADVGTTGWDYDTLTASGKTYFFEVAAG